MPMTEMDEMTPQELNSYLENIARMIEATAGNAEDAARIVRDSKVEAWKTAMNRLASASLFRGSPQSPVFSPRVRVRFMVSCL